MTRATTWLLAAALAGWMSLPAQGQVLIDDGGSASDHASGGSIRERAPGQRVNAGVAQHLSFGGAPEVTDTAPDEDAARRFLLVESINTVFDQINEAILLFRELLLLRAGRTSIPTLAAGKAEDVSASFDAPPGSGRMVKLGLSRLQSDTSNGPSTERSPDIRKR